MDYSQATDEIYGVIKTTSALWNPIFGYTPEIRWQGVPIAGRPDPSKSWARVSNKIVTAPQATLGDLQGKKRFRETGLLFIQFFASRNEVGSKEFGKQASLIMQSAFRKPSPSGNIIFREAKIVELDATTTEYPFNIVVTFEYDSIQ